MATSSKPSQPTAPQGKKRGGMVPRERPITNNRKGARLGITPKQWDVFLECLKTNSNVTRSAEAAGFEKTSVYERCIRDPEFKVLFEQAKLVGVESWEDEVERRAFNGNVEDVWWQGTVVGTRKIFSDQLAQFMLRGAKPEKYKDRVQTDNVNVNVETSHARLDDDALDAELKRRLGV